MATLRRRRLNPSANSVVLLHARMRRCGAFANAHVANITENIVLFADPRGASTNSVENSPRMSRSKASIMTQ